MSAPDGTAAERKWRNRQLVPSSRRFTQWTFAGLRVTLLLACLTLITFVVSFNPLSWDLSEERLFSLSSQTRTVLETLEQPVTLTVFVEGAKNPGIERILLAYSEASPRVDYRLLDLEAEPALAAEFLVRKYNTLVVEAADQVQRSEVIEEPAITNAILAVTRGEPVEICFLAGHGERSTLDNQRVGLSAAVKALQQTNYAAAVLNVGVQGDVPSSCRVVVIAGPTADILPPEREALERYLDAGGRLMLMLESGADVPELEALAAAHGVTPNADFVIDTGRNGQQFGLGLQVPLVDVYTEHPITADFRLMTLYNMPRSLTVAEDLPTGIDARPLAESTRSSWGETNFDRNVGAMWDEGTELNGPLAMMVAVSAAVEETPRAYRDRMRRGDVAPVGDPIMVIVGDVDIATNSFFGWQGNGDLFLNSVNWLAGQQELISIRPKEIANKRVLMTQGRKAMSFVLLVVLLPMIPAVTGVVIMIKRVK